MARDLTARIERLERTARPEEDRGLVGAYVDDDGVMYEYRRTARGYIHVPVAHLREGCKLYAGVRLEDV